MMWGVGRGPLAHDLGLSHPFRAVLQTDRLLKTCAWTVRFSCQGSPFHCDKRQLRALDSADGHASCPAMMEDELVRRRKWLSREKFLDLLGASNLMPGPSSSELAIHIGYLRGGWPGLLVAGICFIVPAACIVAALAWAYVHFGKLSHPRV